MRILVISNLYPPHYIGGYELGCRDVVNALEQRGHTIRVLTSTYNIDHAQDASNIYRGLETELTWNYRPSSIRYWLWMARKEWRSRAMFKCMIEQWCPDVVYIWNMRAISLSIVLMAQQMGLPICYYVSDGWLAQSNTIDRWLTQSTYSLVRIFKRALEASMTRAGLGLSKSSLDLRYVQFTSGYLKQAALNAGKPVAQAQIIHWGIAGQDFPDCERLGRTKQRLLYVGQVVPKKGVHIAIDAYKILYERYGYHNLDLSIVGGTSIPAYAAQLKTAVEGLEIEDHIHFTGLIPRERLPMIYQEHDILIFPSIWDEPFSITLIEAMSSGVAIVGTNTGGSAEILRDEENALIFPKEDAEVCARQIARLLEQPELFERIRTSGRSTVEKQFQIAHTIDLIEQSLLETQRNAAQL